MTDADEFLAADDVQEALENNGPELAAAVLVRDVYAETRLNADSVLEEAGATEALKRGRRTRRSGRDGGAQRCA